MERPNLELSDEQLRRLKAGDKEIMHLVFTQLQPSIYRYIWMKTTSIEYAEDFVQETFLRLWETRDKINPGKNLQTYLFTIAHNIVTDHLRQKLRHRELKHEYRENLEGEHNNSADLTELNDLQQTISKIIKAMPDGPGTALMLSRYDELSHKEIAEIMNISKKTVEKHVGKALKILKTELKKYNF